jgi:hypothetical protein
VPEPLPGADRIVIFRAKLVGYLLNAAHPDGGPKARFFERFGFAAGRWRELADALRRHAQTHPARAEPSPYGTRWIVEGTISTPSGRSPRVRSVWFTDTAGAAPRLVTAYPLPEQT